MTIIAPDLEDFGRLVDALTPWLDQVVIIGGWAHRLYRFRMLSPEMIREVCSLGFEQIFLSSE